MSRFARNTLVYLLILISVIAIMVAFFRPSKSSNTLQDLSQVTVDARAGRIELIQVHGDILNVTLTGGTTYKSRKEHGESALEILERSDAQDISRISIEVKGPSFDDGLGLVIQFLPIVIFTGLILLAAFKLRMSNLPPQGSRPFRIGPQDRPRSGRRSRGQRSHR